MFCNVTAALSGRKARRRECATGRSAADALTAWGAA